MQQAKDQLSQQQTRKVIGVDDADDFYQANSKSSCADNDTVALQILQI